MESDPVNDLSTHKISSLPQTIASDNFFLLRASDSSSVGKESARYLVLENLGEGGMGNFETRRHRNRRIYGSRAKKTKASQVTVTVDIYALGKILRECFTLLSPVKELRQQLQ